MSLCKEQIEHWVRGIGSLKAGQRKWMKNQLNRFIRRQKIDEDASNKFKRPTKFWEY